MQPSAVTRRLRGGTEGAAGDCAPVRDAEAFERLFRRHASGLKQHLLGYLTDDRADDVVQTVFLRIWRRRRECPLDRITASYLFRTASNEAVHLIARERNLVRLKQGMAGGPRLTPPDPSDQPALTEALQVGAFAALQLPHQPPELPHQPPEIGRQAHFPP